MPQIKRLPPAEAADRLIAAVKGHRAARIERDQAIAAALNSGGSTRQVAELAGLSQTQVRNIGLANGYPNAQVLKEREDEAKRRAYWDDYWADVVAKARAINPHPEGDEPSS